MKDTQRTSPDLAPEQEQIVRSHWEWGAVTHYSGSSLPCLFLALFLLCWTMAMLVRASERSHLCSSPR